MINDTVPALSQHERVILKHRLYNADCLDVLQTLEPVDTIFADPPDNIGLGYGAYKDALPSGEYANLLREWLHHFIYKAKTVWCSFNVKWTFEMGQIAFSMLERLRGLEIKPCIQTFTFGQHNHHDLGNNYRPLWRFRWCDSPLFPDAIRVPSWRQENGDKRADPRGRVPGDVQHEERYRDTLPLPTLSLSDLDRINGQIIRKGADECWPWTGHKRDDYGRIRIGEHLYTVTRLVWRMTRGTDPAGQLILHTCDNPECCNPSHLFIGTDADNNQDKEAKNRGKHPIGIENGLAKLSEDEVIAIFHSTDSNTSLAKKYKVSDVAISKIKNGETWQHVINRFMLGDVFNIPRVTGNSKQRRPWHPTQLNEGLVERCLKLTTPPGGTVLDPFGGTGTTLRVCKRINLPCTLIEVDRDYCQQIAKENDLQPVPYLHRSIWEG